MRGGAAKEGNAYASTSEEKQHAHELVERLDPSQIPTAVRFLEVRLLDPLSRALATAAMDDEPLTDAECKAVAEADEWLKHNEPIPHEQVLADLGLTMEDWDRMGNELPAEKRPSKNKPRRNG